MKVKLLFLPLFLAVLLAALLVLTLPELSADGTPEVSVSGSDAQYADPGEKVSYEIKVENTGDEDDFDIKLRYSNPDGEWTVEVSESSLHIAADGTKSFFVHVTPHDNGTMPDAGEKLEVEAEVTAQTGGGEDSIIVTTTCNQVFGAECSSEQLQKTAKPNYNDGDVVGFTVQVKNTGNGDDDFRCVVNESYTDENIQDWVQITKGMLINGLAPGSSGTVEIEVTVRPYDEDHDATSGEKDFWIEVYSKGARDNGKEEVNETTDFFKAIVDVDDYYFLKIDALDSHVPELSEGESDSFRVKVENLGNNEDTVSMVKNGDDEGKHSTWQEFDRPSLEMEPGTWTTVNMTITVKDGDAEAGIYNFYYYGKSQSDTSVESQEDYNSIELVKTYGVEAEPDQDNSNVKPGETIQYWVALKNTGNVWDNFSWQMADTDDLGWVSLDVGNVSESREDEPNGYNRSTGEFTLEAGYEIDIPFLVSVPPYTPEQDEAEAEFEYLVTLRFTSRGDSSENDEMELETTIEQIYDVQAELESDTNIVKTKEKGYVYTDFEIDIRNLGNGEDIFTIEVPAGELSGEMEDWTVEFRANGEEIPEEGIELQTLEQEDISVVIGVDDRTAPKLYDLDVRMINEDEDPATERILTLYLNCSKTEYGVKLEAINEDQQWNRQVNPADMPDDGIRYDFTVENTGDGEDSFLMEVETNTGSGTYRDWTMLFETKDGLKETMMVPADLPTWGGGDHLDVDEEVEISLFVRPPVDEEPSGNDPDKFGDMEISATSWQDHYSTESIFFRVIIIRPNLVLDDIDIHFDTTEKINLGDTVELEITIHNTGNADSGTFDVWVYRNKEDSIQGEGETSGLIAHIPDVENLSPNSEILLTQDWVVEWGENHVFVHVDKPIESGLHQTLYPDQGGVVEESERDNFANTGIDVRSGKPYSNLVDLRPWVEISGVETENAPVPGTTSTITVTIFNNGSQMAVAGYGTSTDDVAMFIKCKAGDDHLKPVTGGTAEDDFYWVKNSLNPGDVREIEFEWVVTGEEETEVTITAEIEYHLNKNELTTLQETVTTGKMNTKPTITVTGLKEGGTLEGTVTISGTAADEEGSPTQVQISIDGGEWQNATGTDSWNFKLKTKDLEDGEHVLKFRTYDGNLYSDETSITVKVDNGDDGPAFSLAVVALCLGFVTISKKRGRKLRKN